MAEAEGLHAKVRGGAVVRVDAGGRLVGRTEMPGVALLAALTAGALFIRRTEGTRVDEGLMLDAFVAAGEGEAEAEDEESSDQRGTPSHARWVEAWRTSV